MVGWHFYNGLDGSPYKTWKKEDPAEQSGPVRSAACAGFASGV